MKIYNKIKLDIDSWKVLKEDSFEYEGPLLYCDGTSSSSISSSSSSISSSSSTITEYLIFGDNDTFFPGIKQIPGTLKDSYTEFINHLNFGHSDVVRVGAMTGDVQYDGYFRIDTTALHTYVSSIGEIQTAKLWVKTKTKFRGNSAITVESRRIIKIFNPGTGDGIDSTSSEVDWLDAQHDVLEWERHWQTRNDKEYVVQGTEVNIDTTAFWYTWNIKDALTVAFNNDDILRVKLERKRETPSGVWDFHSNEDLDDSDKPYLEIFFSSSSSSNSSSSESSSSESSSSESSSSKSSSSSSNSSSSRSSSISSSSSSSSRSSSSSSSSESSSSSSSSRSSSSSISSSRSSSSSSSTSSSSSSSESNSSSSSSESSSSSSSSSESSSSSISCFVEVNDDFTGSNGSQPDTQRWLVTTDAGNAMSIQNNKLNYNSVAAGALSARLQTKGFFARDFRIEIDWDITTITTPSANSSFAVAFQMKRASDAATIATVARVRTSGGADNYYSDGSDVAINQYSTTDTTGMMRIDRVDSTTTIYIWTGAQWEWNGDTNGRIVSFDDGDNWLYSRITFIKELNGTLNSNVDNFEMVSGEYICPTSSSSSSISSSQIDALEINDGGDLLEINDAGDVLLI